MNILKKSSMIVIACGIGAAVAVGAPVDEKTIAPLPPMGWNSWNAFHKDIDEQLIRDTTDIMVSSGLAEVGYDYVCIDDGWNAGDGGDDADGITVNTDKFPSGIGSMADYVHSKGLKFGLYTRWHSIGHEERDAKVWADWGVDFIKNDAWKTPSTSPYWEKMHKAIRAMKRPIVHSIHFSDEESNPENISSISNMWRVTNDIQDYYSNEQRPKDKEWAFTTLSITDRMAGILPMIKPGCWPDPDMLEIGNGGLETADRPRTNISLNLLCGVCFPHRFFWGTI